MGRIQWITHKDIEIAIISYAGIRDGDEYYKAIGEATASFVKEAEEKSNGIPKSILLLLDVKDSVLSSTAVTGFQESAEKTKLIIKKLAVVGIEGIRKVLLQGVNTFTGVGGKPFSEKEDALNWLVQ